jgi:hypothetical protein
LNRNDGVDGTGSFHNVVDLASFNLRCKVLRRRASIQAKDNQQSGQYQYESQNEPRAFSIHESSDRFR